MPPRRTPLTVGVLGTGSTSRKNAVTQVSNLIAGKGAKFILPVTQEHYSDAVRAIADFARKNEYGIEVITDDSTDELDDVEELLEEAVRRHKVAKVPRKLVSLVGAAGSRGEMLLAWDDEDPDCGYTLGLALEAGIVAKDLTDGLQTLTFESDEDEDTPAAVVDSGPIQVTAVAPEDDDDEPEDEPAATAATAEDEDLDEPVVAVAKAAEPVVETPADEAQVTYAAPLVLPEPEQVVQSLASLVTGTMALLLEEIRTAVREEVAEATKPKPRGRPRKTPVA